MSKKAGYYVDKDGATWLRLGGLGIVYENPYPSIQGRPQAVWSWDEAKRRWGPMRLDLRLVVG